MSGLSKVIIGLSTNGLGQLAAQLDGVSGLIVSGVAVAGQFALGDVIGPFFSLAEVEAKGINSAYDTTNTCIAYKQIKDFYAEAGTGAELWVIVAAKTISMATMFDKDGVYAPKLMNVSAGRIKMIAISRVPQTGYTATYSDQFDDDIWSAVTNGKALRADLFSKGMPVQLFIEGRDFQGTVASVKDLASEATTNAPFISVMIGQDTAYATANAHAAKYASVGVLLGRAASIQVQRNIGRVLDGPRLSIANPGLSNGSPLKTATTVNFTDTQLGVLTDRNYILFRTIQGKSGAYFNNDFCACPRTSDYNRISRCRPIDKAVRITNSTYIDELLDDPELNPETGKLDASVIKQFQSKVELSIQTQMITNPQINNTTGVKEISGVRAVADPNQDVVTTNKVAIKLSIVPKGMTDAVEVELGYATSLNQ
ncbi:MAG: DUF2586 family protein [Bacteroidetes bacterium]|nr:DUF2586 family protein [Bacteroidota bacterium]